MDGLGDEGKQTALQQENRNLRDCLNKTMGLEDTDMCSPPQKETFSLVQQQIDLTRRSACRPHGEDANVVRQSVRERRSVGNADLERGFSVPLQTRLRQVQGNNGKMHVDVDFQVQRRCVIMSVYDSPQNEEEEAGMDDHGCT